MRLCIELTAPLPLFFLSIVMEVLVDMREMLMNGREDSVQKFQIARVSVHGAKFLVSEM